MYRPWEDWQNIWGHRSAVTMCEIISVANKQFNKQMSLPSYIMCWGHHLIQVQDDKVEWVELSRDCLTKEQHLTKEIPIHVALHLHGITTQIYIDYFWQNITLGKHTPLQNSGSL